MSFKDFWYVACKTTELKKGQILSRQILDEWVALFRTQDGQLGALLDRCAHRAGRLSAGKIAGDRLICHYHGWAYDRSGQVIRIPSESPNDQRTKKCTQKFLVQEQDGYIYICLGDPKGTKPLKLINFENQGYWNIRLQHHFENNVSNCVENFVDIPHTTFVHPGIFRFDRRQKLTAQVLRSQGRVRAIYGQETDNFGLFSKILNPSGEEIKHIDEFISPNVTCVQYFFGKHKHFIITSQSIPISADETRVYTDLTYNYGWWSPMAWPIIWMQAKAIIKQDIKILGQQMQVIKKYGDHFQNSQSDVIHTFIDSLRNEISMDRDPNLLPEKNLEIEFWI